MNLNSEMFREIKRQLWFYRRNNPNQKNLAIVINPDFYYGVTMEIIQSTNKAELYGMEVNLCQYIEPNEFIIGEKFSVEETK